MDNLVTIRQGELAFNPFKNKVENTENEILKIAGKAGSWECLFYESEKSSCTIHKNRPLECRLLKCWDIGDIQQINGKEYLTRSDLLKKNDPLREYIDLAEKQCSYLEINSLLQEITDHEHDQPVLKKLTTILQQDLLIRDKAVSLYRLSLQQELFYFGRPLFQTVRDPQLQIKLEGTRVRIRRLNL